MSGLDLSRSYDLFRPEQARSRVHVIGAGAVGNRTVQMLAAMGVPAIEVYDFDVVEAVNCGPQGYRLKDVTVRPTPPKPKVVACAEIAREFTGIEIVTHCERYERQRLNGIVITAVDDIDVRRAIWEQVKYDTAVELFIDPRMGGLTGVLRTARPCDPDDLAAYEPSLFPKAKADPAPCTARAISYNAAGLASQICATVRRWWVMGERHPVIRSDYERLNFR